MESRFFVFHLFTPQTPDTSNADENGLDEACGGADSPEGDVDAALVNGVPIEESLFEEDDIDDLELEDLEIVDWRRHKTLQISKSLRTITAGSGNPIESPWRHYLAVIT